MQLDSPTNTTTSTTTAAPSPTILVPPIQWAQRPKWVMLHFAIPGIQLQFLSVELLEVVEVGVGVGGKEEEEKQKEKNKKTGEEKDGVDNEKVNKVSQLFAPFQGSGSKCQRLRFRYFPSSSSTTSNSSSGGGGGGGDVILGSSPTGLTSPSMSPSASAASFYQEDIILYEPVIGFTIGKEEAQNSGGADPSSSSSSPSSPRPCSQAVLTGQSLQIKLQRTIPGSYWPRLTKEKMRKGNVTSYWAMWKEEDEVKEEEEEEENKKWASNALNPRAMGAEKDMTIDGGGDPAKIAMLQQQYLERLGKERGLSFNDELRGSTGE